jgi:hypothetical protein
MSIKNNKKQFMQRRGYKLSHVIFIFETFLVDRGGEHMCDIYVGTFLVTVSFAYPPVLKRKWYAKLFWMCWSMTNKKSNDFIINIIVLFHT